MPTFLEICKDVDTLLGSQGEITSVNASGYQALLVSHVRGAWVDIQNLRDRWNFLHDSVDITLTLGKMHYSIFDIFSTSDDPVSKWELSRFIYDKDTLKYVPYDDFILEDWGEVPDAPSKFSTGISSNELDFNSPDKAYLVTAHYYKKAQVLTGNTDVPLAPSQFHNAIVYQAASDLSLKLGVVETYQLFLVKAHAAIASMMRTENPTRRVRTRGIA